MRTAKRLRKSHLLDYTIRVLEAYAESYHNSEDFYFCNFAHIVKSTGLKLKQVRRTSRRLARAGWLKYGKGLWTEDGAPAGAGYALTPLGNSLLELTKEYANGRAS